MKRSIKRIVFKYNFLFEFYYNYLYKPDDELSSFLNNLSKMKSGKLFFIQIGANDGQWNDPIYKFIRRDRWRGILVEPQKIIFDRLVNNYKNLKNLYFENTAINANEGEKSLFKISFSSSQWASGISSFIRNDIQKLIDAGYIDRMSKLDSITPPADKEEWITEEKVKVTTLKNLILKYRVQSIDLVMIDTEGYDYEIIKSIPFEIIKPGVIVYEHSHFTEYTKKECSKFLIEKGYRLTYTESDTIAELI